MGSSSGQCPDANRVRVGRADNLRPVSTIMLAGMTILTLACSGLVWVTDLMASQIVLGLTVSMSVISVAMGLWRIVLSALSRRPAAPPLPEALLPRYTIIVPLFREAHMLPALTAALRAIDYPRERLDIILACEAIDAETVAAARHLCAPPVRLVVVPPVRPDGDPQTKPRALNHALSLSRGEIVTIYDAEDRPHPQQVRAAAHAFAAHPDWAALQAPLDYFNTDDGWLARQCGLEYAGLFHVVLPGCDRLAMPFPLGGTSNHIRRSALDAIGGWDAFNVTEDADLTFRLAAGGERIGWIAPPTLEEACYRPGPWFRQRSRWMKGYAQTWLVHMHRPRQGGWRRAFMLQMSVGLSLLSALVYAPVILWIALRVAAQGMGWIETAVPPLFLAALIFSLLSGMSVGALGAIRAGKPRLLWSVPLMPLYWLMLFPPLIAALWELRTRPFHWHKTEHGVTGLRPTPEPPSDPGATHETDIPAWTRPTTSSSP